MPIVSTLIFLITTTTQAQTDTAVVDPNPEVQKAEEQELKQEKLTVGPEEIVVTARKREESLQDVPISISAFTADQLRESGAVSNYDVALLTPNFSTLQQTGRRQDRPVVRGQSAPANRGEPNASYFIDGAFVSGSISTTTLGPVERVEVLRGPQSAQFGRATFSGAINYVTRKPTNEWEGELQTKAGTDDTYVASLWGSGPIVEDKLLFFGSVAYDKYGGEWHNNLQDDQATIPNSFVDPPQQGDSSRLGDTETKDFLGKLVWQINDTAELTFKANYTTADDGHYPQLIVETAEFNCYPNDDGEFGTYCGVLDVESVHTNDRSDPRNGTARQNRLNLPDIRTGMTSNFYTPDLPGWQSQGEEVGTVRDQYRHLLQYDQDLGDWGMIIRAAHNEDNLEQGFDLDHLEKRQLLGLFAFYQEQNVRDDSLEIRFDSPGDSALRGSIGAYYFNSNWDSRQHSNVGLYMGEISDKLRLETRNYAAFGSLEYDLTDKWTFSTEARYAREEKDADSPSTCSNDPDNPNFDPDKTISDSISTNSLTPRFTLRYQPTDVSMVYIQASKGNKPGDFNIPYYQDDRDGCQTIEAFENGDAVVKEEKAWTYEVGGKTSWLDNRITTNVAFYYIDWENQGVFQTRSIALDIPEIPPALQIIPETIIENAGKSHVYGMEFESSYFVSQKLQLNLSYGLTVGEYDEYNDPFYASITGEDGDTDPDEYPNGNVDGNTIPDSPKHSVIGGANYTQNLTTDIDWFTNTNIVWESNRYVGADNFIEIDDRTFWNARSGLETDRWSFNGYVNNILDDNSASSVLRFVDLADGGIPAWAASPLPGRTWGVELLVRFGP